MIIIYRQQEQMYPHFLRNRLRFSCAFLRLFWSKYILRSCLFKVVSKPLSLELKYSFLLLPFILLYGR